MAYASAAAAAAFNIDDASAPAPAAADSRAAAVAEFCSHPSLLSLALAAPPAAASSSSALHESEDTYPPSTGDENVAAEAVVSTPKPKLSERDSFIQKLNTLPPIPDATSEESCKEWVAEIKVSYSNFNGGVPPPPYIPDPKVWFDGWGNLSPKDGSYKQRWTLLHEAFKRPSLSIIDKLPAITYGGCQSVTPQNGREGVSVKFIFWYPKSLL